MGTISEKLVYLNGTKQAIKQAINEDFEVIDDNTTFREYADEISSNNAKYKDLIPKETTNATNTLDISNSSGLDKALVTQYGNTKQSILPSEYTQVDYIQSSGTQYIDTGVNADTNLRVILDMAYTNPLSANQAIGSIKIGTPNVRYHLLPTTTEINFWVNDNSYRIAGNDSDRHLIDLNVPNGQVLYDNNVITIPTNISDTGLNFWLFGRNSTTNIYLAKIKQWACKMYYNNVLVRDFIPCYRNSDNEVGLYDLVNDVFYTNQNQGTDAFTYGSKTPTPDTPQEIVNISGKSTLKDVGKNLFDINKVQIGKAWNNTNNSARAVIIIPVEQNVAYAISMNGNNSMEGIYVSYSAETLAENVTNGVALSQITSFPRTYTSSTEYIILQFNKNSISLNDIESLKLQLEKSSTASDYEPYKEQSFDLDLKSKNKYYIKPQTINGVTLSYDEDGAIVLNGTTTGSFTAFKQDVSLNGTFSLSTNNTITQENTYVRTRNSNGTLVHSITLNNTASAVTKTSEIARLEITIGATGITFNNFKIYAQLEESPTPTDFEPFYDIELCKIDTYKDRIYPLNGKWYLEKKNKKLVLIGTENWNYQSEHHRFIMNLSPRPVNGAMCYATTYIKGQTSSAGSNNTISVASGTAYNQLLIHDERFATKNDYNNWLSNNNVEVYYPLETPTTEEITESNYPTLYNQLNNIKLYEGVNHITMTSESGLDVEFDIEYYKDWKLD